MSQGLFKIEEITNHLIMLNSQDEIKNCVFLDSNTVVFSLVNHHRLFVFGNQEIDLSFATFCEQIANVEVVSPDILVVKTVSSVHLLVISKRQQLLIYSCLCQRFSSYTEIDKIAPILCSMSTSVYDSTLYVCVNKWNQNPKFNNSLILVIIDLNSVLQGVSGQNARIQVVEQKDRPNTSALLVAATAGQRVFAAKFTQFMQIWPLLPPAERRSNLISKEVTGECVRLLRAGPYFLFFFPHHIVLQHIDRFPELKEQQHNYDFVLKLLLPYDTPAAAVDTDTGVIAIALGTHLYLIRQNVLNLSSVNDLEAVAYQQFHYKYPVAALRASAGRLQVVHVGRE